MDSYKPSIENHEGLLVEILVELWLLNSGYQLNYDF